MTPADAIPWGDELGAVKGVVVGQLLASLALCASRGLLDADTTIRIERGASPALARGAAGAAVSRWQGVLKSAGLALGKSGPAGDGVDGAFGPATELATRAWQNAHGLPVTGSVGAAEWQGAGVKALGVSLRFTGTTLEVDGTPVDFPADAAALIDSALAALLASHGEHP